jgi:hypothetical protein
MNVKIKELMLECYSPYSNFDHEKFAKLILAECIDICEQTRYDGTVAANRIKFVFGLDNDSNKD